MYIFDIDYRYDIEICIKWTEVYVISQIFIIELETIISSDIAATIFQMHFDDILESKVFKKILGCDSLCHLLITFLGLSKPNLANFVRLIVIFPAKVRLGDFVELFADAIERLIQVQRPNADLITAHLVHTIGLDFFICLRVEQHATYHVILSRKFGFLVFDIGEYLVQVRRVDCGGIVELLRCACIVLGVDDKRPVVATQHDIALHDGEHGAEAVVERPFDLR